jgi:collagen type VII alpha
MQKHLCAALLGTLLLSTSLGLTGCGSSQELIPGVSATTGTTGTSGTTGTTGSTGLTGTTGSTGSTGSTGITGSTGLTGTMGTTGTTGSTGFTGTTGSPGSTGSTGPVTQAPSAVADSYSGRANAEIAITSSNGVLANDVANGGTISASTQPGHGAVTLNSDGSFTYTPTTGYLGTDSFTYTLTNAVGSSTATVAIDLAGTAFFVDNSAPAGGDGSQAHPFLTLAQAQVAATGVAGAQLNVARGTGAAYADPVVLTAGQSLVGTSSTSLPLLTSTVNVTGGGNALANLNLQPAGGAADAIDSAAANGSITNCTLANTTGLALNLTGASGTWTITGCSATNTGELYAETDSGSLLWSVSNSNFSQALSSVSCVVNGTGAQNATIINCTFTGANRPGIGGFSLSGSTTANLYLVAQNNLINTCSQGVSTFSNGNSNISALVQGNTVINSTGFGMQFESFNTTATTKLHVYDNSVTTTSAGGMSFNSDSTIYDLNLNNNTASADQGGDSFGFGTSGGPNGSPSIVITNLSTVQSRNTGNFNFIGANATDGTFAFP